MNKDLMQLVETIVRPVQTSMDSKQRMREELYTLAESIFDEETAAGRDSAAAIDTVKRRIGDPEVVREELQASVLWPDRAQSFIERYFTRRQGESANRYANRVTLTLLLTEATSLSLALSVLGLFGSKGWWFVFAIWQFYLALIVAFGVSAWGITYVGIRLIDRVYDESWTWPRVAGTSLLAGGMVGISLGMLFVPAGWQGLRAAPTWCLIGMVVTMAAFPLVIWLAYLEQLRRRPWDELTISS